MKIRHKTLLALVAGLSGVSMFCVGFASWSFGSGSPTVLGTISAESVISLDEFLQYRSVSLKNSVCDEGFVEDKKIVDKNYVEISFNVNRLGELFEYIPNLKDDGSLTFVTTMSCSGTNAEKIITNENITFSYSYTASSKDTEGTDKTVTFDSATGQSTVIAKYTVKNISTESNSLSVNVTFEIASLPTDTFYSDFKKCGLLFNTKIEVE